MSWTRNVRHPSKLVSIGETIEAVVLKVDPNEEKISLGMKQTEQDPWMVLPLKYPVGTRIKGKVRNLTSFGAFVEIEPGIDGLIHISDMSWTKRVQHPSEVVKKGDAVDVVILNIDSENKRISLGLKQAEEDPWLRIGETYPVGTELAGTVVRLMDKGVVVDIGNDIEGFVPLSQLTPRARRSTARRTSCTRRCSLDMRVLEVDPIHRRIVLGVTNIPEDQPPRPETPSKIIPMESEEADRGDPGGRDGPGGRVTAESREEPEALRAPSQDVRSRGVRGEGVEALLRFPAVPRLLTSHVAVLRSSGSSPRAR